MMCCTSVVIHQLAIFTPSSRHDVGHVQDPARSPPSTSPTPSRRMQGRLELAAAGVGSGLRRSLRRRARHRARAGSGLRASQRAAGRRRYPVRARGAQAWPIARAARDQRDARPMQIAQPARADELRVRRPYLRKPRVREHVLCVGLRRAEAMLRLKRWSRERADATRSWRGAQWWKHGRKAMRASRVVAPSLTRARASPRSLPTCLRSSSARQLAPSSPSSAGGT